MADHDVHDEASEYDRWALLVRRDFAMEDGVPPEVVFAAMPLSALKTNGTLGATDVAATGRKGKGRGRGTVGRKVEPEDEEADSAFGHLKPNAHTSETVYGVHTPKTSGSMLETDFAQDDFFFDDEGLGVDGERAEQCTPFVSRVLKKALGDSEPDLNAAMLTAVTPPKTSKENSSRTAVPTQRPPPPCSPPPECFTEDSAFAPAEEKLKEAVSSTEVTTEQFLRWFYRDPQGTIQGPFSSREMERWNSVGYFSQDLPIRHGDSGAFHPLREVFPSPLVPFQSKPMDVAAPPAAASVTATLPTLQQQQDAAAAGAAAGTAAALRAATAASPAATTGYMASLNALGVHAMAGPTLGLHSQAHVHAKAHALAAHFAGAAMASHWQAGVPSPFDNYNAATMQQMHTAYVAHAAQAAALAATHPAAAAASAAAAKQAADFQSLMAMSWAPGSVPASTAAPTFEGALSYGLSRTGAEGQTASQQPRQTPTPASALNEAPAPAAQKGAAKRAARKQKQQHHSGEQDSVARGAYVPEVPKPPPVDFNSASDFPTLGSKPGVEERVVMVSNTDDTSGGGFWERPARPVKIAGSGLAVGTAAKSGMSRREQMEELLAHYGLTLDEPVVGFLLTLTSPGDVLDYLQEFHSSAEDVRRFAEAVAERKLCAPAQEATSAAASAAASKARRNGRGKGREVDPSLLGFTAAAPGGRMLLAS